IQNPGVSIVGYSQPERFYPIYARLKERRDGAVDRMLIYQPKPKRLTATETKRFITQLHQSHVKDLRSVYEGIYTFCHDENDVLTLSLAAVLHLFYDQLKKRLESLPASPPANVVNKATLKQAIALAHYFAEQRKVLDQLGNMETGAVSKKADPKSIASRVLTCPGPFSTVRLAQSSISGHIRPAAVTIVEIMQNLERDGLGKVIVVDRTTVFYKSLPCNVDEEVLGNYGVILGNYSNQFKERAAHTIVSRDLFNRMLNMSPDKVDLERVYAITSEED
ncbi:unnamed protein product, partial [Porites lobata]